MQTGLSAAGLQKWQIVGQLTDLGLTAETVTSSIISLQSHITAIQMGRGNSSPFAWMGVDASGNSDALQVLDQLREKVNNFPRAKAVSLITEMGLNPGFINILTLSKEKFDALFASMGRSQATQQQLVKLGTAIVLLKLQFSLWKDNFVASITPALLKGGDALTKFATAASHAWEVFSVGISSIPHIKDVFLALLPVIGLVTAAMYPLTATLLALILIFDDLYTYMHGGDSVTGDLLAWTKTVGEKLSKSVRGYWDEVSTWVRANIIDPLDAVIQRTKWLKDAADAVNKAYDRVTAKEAVDPQGKGAEMISHWPMSPLEWLRNGVKKSDSETFIQHSNGSPDASFGGTPLQPSSIRNTGSAPAGAVGAPRPPPDLNDEMPQPHGSGPTAGPALSPEPNPPAAVAAANGPTFYNTFVIDGSAGATEHAHKIADHLQTQLNHSISDFNNGPVR